MLVVGRSQPVWGMGKNRLPREPLRSKDLPKKHPKAPEYFAICTATADGRNFKEIIKDPRRAVTHGRVSKDHQWITFTRHNKFNARGIAIPETSYKETEILMCRIDGSEIQTLVPPKKGATNCNSYWTPDGKSIIYVSSDNPEKKGRIYLLDIETRTRKQLSTPDGYDAGDPYTDGTHVVFPARKPNVRGGHVIHIMNMDGTGFRRLSSVPQRQAKGEYDPKISPDGKKVAFMRAGKKGMKGEINLIVTDINTGAESNLSVPASNNWDAMPEWSSDGKRLIFWHVNRKEPLKSGLYTITADGSDRRRISLPKGYQYTICSFWPGTGSGPDAKIIFSVRKFSPQIRRQIEQMQK